MSISPASSTYPRRDENYGGDNNRHFYDHHAPATAGVAVAGTAAGGGKASFTPACVIYWMPSPSASSCSVILSL
jgi:hypothetical protein